MLLHRMIVLVGGSRQGAAAGEGRSGLRPGRSEERGKTGFVVRRGGGRGDWRVKCFVIGGVAVASQAGSRRTLRAIA